MRADRSKGASEVTSSSLAPLLSGGAVCDAYDAMTTDRPYRAAMASDEALAELRKRAGTQFDPELVDAFVEMIERRTSGTGAPMA